jgi:hypothetical protein
MTGRRFLFGLMVGGLVFAFADHLLSPPLHASQGTGEVACAPCGAPCPSTK